MHKHLIIFLIFFVHAQNSSGQYKNLKKFIPAGFTILASASGDINKDGIKDRVLILRNHYENLNPDTARPLLLLQGNGAGQYKLIARNDSVTLCMGCGGVHGDPYQGITIKNGYFSIKHFGGSGWRWTRIITFKFNPKTKLFYLHRDAGESWYISEPDKKTPDLFNEEDFDKLTFDKFSYNKNR
jgi:hypothetical protein